MLTLRGVEVSEFKNKIHYRKQVLFLFRPRYLRRRFPCSDDNHLEASICFCVHISLPLRSHPARTEPDPVPSGFGFGSALFEQDTWNAQTSFSCFHGLNMLLVGDRTVSGFDRSASAADPFRTNSTFRSKVPSRSTAAPSVPGGNV